MVTVLKEVDAVVVGMGWTGSILARELTKAGLTAIGLERGGIREWLQRRTRHPPRPS